MDSIFLFHFHLKQSVSAVYLHDLLHSFNFKSFNCSFHRVDKQVVIFFQYGPCQIPILGLCVQ